MFGQKGFHERFSRDDIFQGFDINEILSSFGVNKGKGFGDSPFQSPGGTFGSFDQFWRGPPRETFFDWF